MKEKMKYIKFLASISIFASSSALAQSEVSVLMVYTDDARAAVGSTNGIETDLVAAISEGNRALSNSNVNMRLTIAGMREISVNENLYSSAGEVLRDLTNSNHPVFGQVHEWRDETSADMVYLNYEGIQQNGQADDICGAGTPCDQRFASSAFAVGQRGLMEVAPIVIHELGHLMGLRHDSVRDCRRPLTNCGRSRSTYSWGYIDPRSSPQWGTIMAGGRPFPLIEFFSSPNLVNPDTNQVLGDARFADAARHLNDVRELVAAWREDNDPPPSDRDCDEDALDFRDNVGDYEGQSAGSTTISEDGCAITLSGNEWQITDSTINIGPNTVVTFAFSTNGAAAEIQGIGFDTNNSGPSANQIYRLDGTQNYGISDFSYDGDVQTFSIPVGRDFTGTGFRFVIVNDQDNGATNNELTVSNVRFSEE